MLYGLQETVLSKTKGQEQLLQIFLYPLLKTITERIFMMGTLTISFSLSAFATDCVLRFLGDPGPT